MTSAGSPALTGTRVLITGGAGFIGSRLAKALDAAGASVTLYDNLLEQVHGPSPVLDLPGTLIVGDIRDRQKLDEVLRATAPELVIHLAADTGTGQSADEPGRYAEVNVVGTANLIEGMKALPTPPRRVLLAATRAVYGEGAYRGAGGQIAIPAPRDTAAMAEGIFDVRDESGTVLSPVPTPVGLPPAPGSVYGSTKLMQEYLLQQTPAPWDHVILRLQNVYGPGQSLRNPYTGVLSIFTSQAMRGESIGVYEDGEIYRDFVFVDDVVAAFVAACDAPAIGGRIFNIGTGEPLSILAAARWILEELDMPASRCSVNGKFRPGDIRYAVADIADTLAALPWAPQVTPREGVRRLVDWAKEQASITA